MFGRKSKFLSTVDNPSRGYDSFEMRLGDEMRGERATLGKSLLDVQRELRIKASYIAAIENADLSAFDSLSFVAGYVRSYARYLDLDPETTFARFCEETGFGGFSALKPMESEASRRAAVFALKPSIATKAPARKIKPSPTDPLMGAGNPFANKSRPVFAGFEPGALGSLAVLMVLIGGLGYGGWTVVKEIQRVQVAPVEQAPDLIAELDPLAPADAERAAPDETGVDAPARDALARLYRPQALDAPILTARDAPIATILPGTVGAFASAEPATPSPVATDTSVINASVNAALAEAMGMDPEEAETPATPRVLAQAPDAVVLVAVRAAWVRVRSAEGATLFEKILEPGETYEVPLAEAPATLRAGNSGAVYMSVAGETYGPLAPGAQVVSNVALTAEAVRENYALADLEDDSDLARVVAELTASEPAPETAAETPPAE
ncbi:helix-turn-helix domain-containing protein [Jannaschia rubra]|uniref:Cytoskeletal protein RodZ n=1 Tax=Jannaschia rubra TaxID=282197 RepID=A0A0M6XU90_9RHOB|nr:helix-turn-helix domain-containing protein [Jannaschia rubra]CTQ34302.1 cytoskeletal protein RodZ [Jannaschia rubra]SFG18422.1 protein RodZ, contains Xre-like HTH and DUF4115 domains [Jannaschia rubra]